MSLRKKQAPTPKKAPVRRKAQKKKMILSKEGREVEKRLVELVDLDIEEHNKLSAFEIDTFLANLLKELDPTIELPEISKEPAKAEKTSDAKATEKEPEGEEQEGEGFQVIKSATKVEATKENRENEAKEVEASAEKSSPKGTNKKTAVKDQAEKAAAAEEAGKGKASIGELHEMIKDIVTTATTFEKSRRSRRVKGGSKSVRKDAPPAS